MRLFIAKNFSTETRNRLVVLRDELSSRSKHGRFSLIDNIHLTLVFLGECNEKQTDAAKSAMSVVTFDPFDIEIDRIGCYKHDGGDVWWAGVRDNEALTELQSRLTKELTAEGFSLEKRKYTPHITLGRNVITDTKPHTIVPFKEIISTIDLIKSESANGKLTYTSIYRRGKWLMPIVVEPYDPQWSVEFEKIKAFLLPYIGDLIVDIHHVGSTSVPGLSAKPIIDFDIEIASMEVFPQVKKQLGKLGFHHEGDYGISGREVFKPENPDDFMLYHMYVCPTDSVEFKQHLCFRYALRISPDTKKEYEELKTVLAEKCGNDIDAYIDGKTGFIRSILERFI